MELPDDSSSSSPSSPPSVDSNGRVIASLKPCGCKNRCLFGKIKKPNAVLLRKQFRSLSREARDVLLYQSIIVSDKGDGVSNRTARATYRVNAGTNCRKVCRNAFKIIFAISEDKITRIMMTKKSEYTIIPAKLKSGGSRPRKNTVANE